MIQKINYADKQTGGKFSASDANEIKSTVNLNADVLSENSQSILSLQGGSLGPIKPTDAAPTPGINRNYTFIIGGDKPAWLTAEAGVTTVKAGDGVAVVFTPPSSYTYTHVDVNSQVLQKTVQIEDPVGMIGGAITITPNGFVLKTIQLNYSRLYGKTCCVLGDSFIAGDYFATDVCNLLNMAIINKGYSGYCIADGGYGLGGLRSKIDEALATNTDVIIFEGGLNDWYCSVPIGNETDSVYTTYYGALNYIANKIATCGRNISIIPINLQQRNTSKQSGGDIGRANFLEQENYANIFKRVFEKYGIKTCDVFHELGITYENAALYTTDGVHPNAAGSIRWKNYLTQWILSNATVPFDETAITIYQNADIKLVTWNILRGFSLLDSVIKSTSQSGNWTGSAYSTETITVADVNGLQSEILAENHPLIDGIAFGISIDNLPIISPSYNSIDYGFYTDHTNNAVKVYENGTIKYSTTKTANVKLQIKVNNRRIEYYIDGNLAYKSLSIPTIGNTYKVVATNYYSAASPATLSNVKLINYNL